MRPLTPRQAERRRRRAIKVAYKRQQYEDACLQEEKTEAFLRELAENERRWQALIEELEKYRIDVELREQERNNGLAGCAALNLIIATLYYLGNPGTTFSAPACYFHLSLIVMLGLGYRYATYQQPPLSTWGNLFSAAFLTLFFLLIAYGLYRLFT